MRLACVYVPQLTLRRRCGATPARATARGADCGAGAETRGERRLRPREPIAGGAEPSGTSQRSCDAGGRYRGNRIVVELDAAARRAGVRPGMTAAQASAVCPGSASLHGDGRRSGGGRRRARRRRLRLCAARGQQRRTNASSSTPPISDSFTRTASTRSRRRSQAHAARLGLAARVAIAPSKGMARVATRAHALAVVPAGSAGARAFVAPLPVELLTADARCCARRSGAGERAPPERSRRCRPTRSACGWARAGAAVARLARGEDDEPFVPLLPPDALEEAVELDYPVYEIEPLAFVLRGSDRSRRWPASTARSLACAGLTLRLSLDPRGLDVRTVPIAAPTREGEDAARAGAAGHRPPPARSRGRGRAPRRAAGARARHAARYPAAGGAGPRSPGDDAGAAGGAGRTRKRRRARDRRQLARAGGRRDPVRSTGSAAARQPRPSRRVPRGSRSGASGRQKRSRS